MSKPQHQLRTLIRKLRRQRSELTSSYRLDEARWTTDLIKKLDQISKDLAAGQTPAKVLIAVFPDGSKEGVVALAGTVPVMVVMVDHRPKAVSHLRLDEVPAMAVPTEFIEAVSDEAAEYLSCKADQLSVLSKL